MALTAVYERVVDALAAAAENFVSGLVDLLVVLIFLGLGYLVAGILVGILKHFLERIKLEHELKKRDIHDALLGFTLTDVLCKFLKLLTLAVFLGIAAEVTNLRFLGELVMWFIGYVPLLLQGLTIIVLALLAGDYVTDRVKKSGIPFANMVGWVFEAFVFYTALVISLPLILPNADVSILRWAFVLILGAFAVAIALGLGLAMGFGMKDTIAAVAKKRQSDLEKLV